MTGIVEVAEAAGVSPATVSRALRGLPGVSAATRRTVQAAADRLGYVPSPSAAALPTGRTRTVAILTPWVSRWFFTAVIDGAKGTFAANGYDVLLYAGDPDVGLPAAGVRRLTKRVDGILAMSLPAAVAEGTQAGPGQSAAVVAVGPAPAGTASVSIDDVAVGHTAGRHLLGLGHRRIGYVGGDGPHLLERPVTADRRNGLVQAMAEAGLSMCPDHVWNADFTVTDGEAAAERMLQCQEPPTAVLAASDEIAIGLIHRLRAEGVRVPQDLSVIGVDDNDISRLFGLTTIAQPVREQGRLAAEMLLALVAGQQVESITMPTGLSVRRTTGPPSGRGGGI